MSDAAADSGTARRIDTSSVSRSNRRMAHALSRNRIVIVNVAVCGCVAETVIFVDFDGYTYGD